MTRHDAHIHLFRCGYRGDRESGAELQQYNELRWRHDVASALVVGYESDPSMGNNEYVLGLAETLEWIAPLPYLHLDAVTSAREVEAWWERGAVGVAVYVSDAAALAAVDSEVWQFLASRRAVVSVNAPAGVWADVGEWLRQVDGAQVLVSHLGLPGSLVGEEADFVRDRIAPVLALVAREHVAVKLSAAYAIDPVWPHAAAGPVVEEVLETFGTGRVVWGSDFSPGLETVDDEQLFALPAGAGWLSPSERAEIEGGTLRGILERVQRA